MPKYAVISDVHANLEALDAVLHQAQGLNIICLGDLVDYGASPNEVVETIREKATLVILGNHDQAACTGDTSYFNARAAISSKWTGKKLTYPNLEYLKGLPGERMTNLGGGGVYLAHGSPDDQLWEYVYPATHHQLFGYYLRKKEADVIGLGHTHVPYVWRESTGVVFNPGSVGQPRDGDWRASWAELTVEKSSVNVEIRRTDYDVKGAASKIREAGLPASFADRLSAGT